MKRYLIAIVACFTQQSIIADPVISLFLRPYPNIAQEYHHDQELLHDISKPGGIAYHDLEKGLERYKGSGIFTTYGGYINVSDYDGHLAFPRKHEKPIIYVVITTKITPNIITANTIHHWDLEPQTSTAIYKIERFQDKETKLFYWNVEQIELPQDMRVPLEALIIFAKPKDVYIPQGISVTKNTPNLTLPDIYIKKGMKVLPSTLYVLNIKQFFGQVNEKYKKQPKSSETLLIP